MLTRSILFLAAIAALAQTYEVRGTVTEQGAGGIPDVQVQILRIEDGATQTTKTDNQGAFRVTVDQPGAYMAGATKAGYTGASSLPILTNQPFRLSPGTSQAVVNITLVRPGEISGRVLDEETREPVIGANVTFFTRQWSFGRPNLLPADREPVVTDAEGRFRIPGARPGEYIATVRDRGNIQMIDKFSAADLEKTDEAYPATYWPGGGDSTTAFGVQLTSSGYADIGTIFTRKAPQYRVHLTMQGSCPEGDIISVSILKRNGGAASPVGSHPCGPLLLQGLDAGSYALYAVSDRRNGNLQTTVSGAVTFEVVDKNLNINVVLQPNLIIEGQLTIAEGAAAPRLLPRITTRPFDLITGAQTAPESTIFWAPDQRHFQLAVSARTQSLVVADPSGAYVKEIRYNGTPLRGSTLPVGAGKLEIMVDDKFGSLALSATDGSRGVPASILILKDPTTLEEMRITGLFTRNTGPDGTLPATQLAPGDYRVVAFSSTAKFHEPGVIERALSTAQRITVSPGGTQTVSIRVNEGR